MIEVMPRSGVYPQQLRDQAVRMVAEARSAHASEWSAITAVAKELGIGAPGTLRRWIRNAESGAATTTSAFEVVEVVEAVEVVESVTAPAVGEPEPSPESDAPVSAPVYAP